jgi:hypothetical protein
MKNGQVPTPNMIGLLMKHADDTIPWTASAPEQSGWVEMMAKAYHKTVIIKNSSGQELFVIPDRNDWTIQHPIAQPKVQKDFIGMYRPTPEITLKFYVEKT